MEAISEAEKHLNSLICGRQWKAAIDLLRPYADSDVPEVRGWAKARQGIILYLQSPCNVHSGLRLTDQALALLEGNPEEAAGVLINGSAMAEYAMDSARHEQYISRIKTLLNTPALVGRWYGRLHMRLGYYFQRIVGKDQAAERHFREAVSYYEAGHDQPRQLQFAYAALADVILDHGSRTEAATVLRKAISIGETLQPTAGILYAKGRLAEALGRYGEAADWFKRALVMSRAGNDHILTAKTAEVLAAILLTTGDRKQAAQVLEPVINELIEAEVPQLALRMQRMLGSILGEVAHK